MPGLEAEYWIIIGGGSFIITILLVQTWTRTSPIARKSDEKEANDWRSDEEQSKKWSSPERPDQSGNWIATKDGQKLLDPKCVLGIDNPARVDVLSVICGRVIGG